MILLVLENFWIFLIIALKKHKNYFFFEKHIPRTWKPPLLIFRRAGTSRADWNQKPKVGGPKIGKARRGYVGFWDPYFWNEKVKENDAKKTLEN